MSETTKWAPGPYSVNRAPWHPLDSGIHGPDDEWLAVCRKRQADLFAAAPELAEALRGLLDLIAYKDGEGNLIPDHLMPMRAARAALAKAEGR